MIRWAVFALSALEIDRRYCLGTVEAPDRAAALDAAGKRWGDQRPLAVQSVISLTISTDEQRAMESLRRKQRHSDRGRRP